MSPPLSVAIQGEPGANSELAAVQYFAGREVQTVPCRSFADLFEAVRGPVPYGMAPVENSLGGSVHDVWDLLARHELPLCGECYFQVRHCLIAHPGTRLQDIRRVYSHEQALAQCRRYLQRLVWIDAEDIVPAYDTAGAVKMIKARGRRGEAAIASPRAAELYAMQVLAADIQTDPRNHTRFLVMGPPAEPPSPGPRRTTLILTTDDGGASLPDVLAALSSRGIALSKLETRKRLGLPWEYGVYVDCAGDASEPPLREALAEIAGLVAGVRVVGSYPAADLPA